MLQDEVFYADAYLRRKPPESGGMLQGLPLSRSRCRLPSCVLQPRREVPPDELLQPQDVFLVGVGQLPAHLRRERRRLGEDTALDVPAQSGREDPFDEDGVPRSERSNPCVQSPDSRYAGGVVLDGRVRDETFV